MICNICDYSGETTKISIFGYCYSCFKEHYEYCIDGKYAILFQFYPKDVNIPVFLCTTKTKNPVLAVIDDVYNFEESWNKLIIKEIPYSPDDNLLKENAKSFIPELEKRWLAKRMK